MKKLFLTLAACASMLSASAGLTWDFGGAKFNVDTVYHYTSGPGMTTTALRIEGADDAVKTIKNNVFYTTIDLTNPDLELRGVQAKDDGDVTENVKAMGERKNGLGNGQYLAGINGDFFNMGGKPTRTNGHSLVDGRLYNIGVGGAGWNAWASYAVVDGDKDIRIQQNVNASKDLIFPNGQTHGYHINGTRWADELVIYTPDSTSTGTNMWGRECPMKLVSGSLASNDAVFEVTGEWVGKCDGNPCGNMEVPRDGFVLSGNGSGYNIMEQLKVGDKISMGTTVTINGKKVNPRQIIGGCPMIVINGEVAPDQYFSDNIIDHFSSNQARTVMGYNKDRTKLIMLVVDKFAKNSHTSAEYSFFQPSSGFAMKRMGQLMKNLGCYTAMALDGGGSSQLYNKVTGTRNVPYGENGFLRPVANGFFAVSTTPVDENVAAIEVVQKNVKLNQGETFTPTVYGYNKYGVLVNKNVTGFTFTVAPALGSVEGTTFTAGEAKNSTHGVVALGDIKAAVRILTNGGGAYVSSGDDDAALEVKAPYVADEPMGIDKDPIFLTEQWHFVNTNYNDGWDGTAPNWEADSVKAKSCVRFATARNGKFYTIDMVTMSIAEIDKDGNLTPLYKLPALEGEINGVPDYYGAAISSDDAGNFLIGHLFTKNDTYTRWTIYSPMTGKAKHFTQDRGSNQSNGRIDNIGRVVGDLTTNAYVYVAPKATGALASQCAQIIHFQGDGNIDNVTATSTFDGGLWLAGSGNTNSICQPKYATVDEMKGKKLEETFYWYSKAAGVGQWTCDLFTRDNGSESPNYCLNWNNHSGLNGFDTFLLGGKRYFVVNYAAADENQNNQHIIVMDEQSNKVAEWTNPDFSSKAGYNTITAIPVNESQVNIYVYNCTGDFFVEDVKTGAIAGALLTLTLGNEYAATEPVDITPSGLNFDSYEDGTPFKLTATGSNGGWSTPAGFAHKHPNAFNEDGQLTAYLDRGAAESYNTQEYVDNTIQQAFVVRKMNDAIGNVLAITQPWSPAASRYQWPSAGYSGNQAQLSFFMPASMVTENTDQRHYVRVRIVYNVLHRGCHYTFYGPIKLVTSYASHENNWVIPAHDADLGALVADEGIDFAQWVDETYNVEDIPAEPVVRKPDADETDAWDPGHKPAAEDVNGYPAYIINDSRYRVYEFDTYIDKPEAVTTSVQFNVVNKNTTYLIKEVKFTDLGTDEAAATLLHRRQLGWTYFHSESSGIEDIVTDETLEGAQDAPVYYNLQGVQVVNPENGIYIVRRGNTVTKEYIR